MKESQSLNHAATLSKHLVVSQSQKEECEDESLEKLLKADTREVDRRFSLSSIHEIVQPEVVEIVWWRLSWVGHRRKWRLGI